VNFGVLPSFTPNFQAKPGPSNPAVGIAGSNSSLPDSEAQGCMALALAVTWEVLPTVQLVLLEYHET